MEKKTPLYQTHVDMGGKIVEFGGFLMPVQYPTGVIAEHMAVREKAGLFDVSHMGELRLKGPDAVANVQKIITADISNMKDGEIKYSMFCNDNGGIIDDFIVYRCAADNYWLVVNAGNREKDAAWVESHLSGDVDYRDEGNDWGQIALQGPKSGDILKKLCDEQYIPAKYYTFIEDVPLNLGERTIRALVSQTGYTGEYGFEIYCKAEDTVDLWKALLKAGEPEGLIPCGRDALVALGAPKMKRIGMKVVGRGIVREHCDLYTMDGEKIGWASSGTFAPYIGCGVAMGYIPAQDIEIGKHLNADVRGRMVELEIVPMPFYKLER